MKVAPFKEESRRDVLDRLKRGKLTEAQKSELSETCWTALTRQYIGYLKYAQGKMLLEIQAGERKPDKEGREQMVEMATRLFAQHLLSETSASLESISEVIGEIKKRIA